MALLIDHAFLEKKAATNALELLHRWPQHPPMPFMAYPYIVALIELDEGVRLVSNLCDIAPGEVKVGMPAEVFYRTFDNDLVLHQFRPTH